MASDNFIKKLTMSSSGSSDERIEPETLNEFTSITLTTLSSSMGANAQGEKFDVRLDENVYFVSPMFVSSAFPSSLRRIYDILLFYAMCDQPSVNLTEN